MASRESKQWRLDRDKMSRRRTESGGADTRRGAADLPPGPATVEFRNVEFFYEQQRQILFDVSFEIPAGKRVAVVGHSGSGKSKLARLLYRFYDVTGGAIRVNGVDIRDAKQSSLRGATSTG